MRTTRLLPVSPNMHCYRGHTCPRGCTCLGMYLPEGVPAGGAYLPEGVPAQVLPPVNRILDTRYWKYYLAIKKSASAMRFTGEDCTSCSFMTLQAIVKVKESLSWYGYMVNYCNYYLPTVRTKLSATAMEAKYQDLPSSLLWDWIITWNAFSRRDEGIRHQLIRVLTHSKAVYYICKGFNSSNTHHKWHNIS